MAWDDYQRHEQVELKPWEREIWIKFLFREGICDDPDALVYEKLSDRQKRWEKGQIKKWLLNLLDTADMWADINDYDEAIDNAFAVLWGTKEESE